MAAKAMTVLAATKRELDVLRKASADAADSATAALVLALAAEVDDPSNSATSKSMCSKVLADLLVELRASAPAVERKDGLDEIAAKRAARRGGAAA